MRKQTGIFLKNRLEPISKLSKEDNEASELDKALRASRKAEETFNRQRWNLDLASVRASAIFPLIRHSDSQNLVRFLDSHGICVLDTTVVSLEEHVRISIGTAAENDALIKALRRYVSQFGIRSGHAA